MAKAGQRGARLTCAGLTCAALLGPARRREGAFSKRDGGQRATPAGGPRDGGEDS